MTDTITEIVMQYAQQFSITADRDITAGDDKTRANNPVLFVFIGDKTADVLKLIYSKVQNKWSNSEGTSFFHIYAKCPVNIDSVHCMKVNYDENEQGTLRKAINDKFCNDENLLSEFNQKVREIQNGILEFGRLYPSYERLNIAIITRSDDPLNILLPEITLILKSRLFEDFHVITSDLYVLLNEKDNSKDFKYSAAVSISFFKELDYMQSDSFVFCKPLETLSGTNKKLDITNCNRSVFDMVYILGEKCEHGFIKANVQNENSEIIYFINMLKNSKMNTNYDSEYIDQYNDSQFRKDISPETGKSAYVTAGLAKVKRPNNAIAVNVLYNFFDIVISRMKELGQSDNCFIHETIHLDGRSIDSRVHGIVCSEDKINEMGSLISISVPYNRLKSMTLKEAEEALYGDTCLRYFDENYVQPANKSLEESKLREQVKDIILHDVVENNRYGLFCACDQLQKVKEIIGGMKKSTAIELEQLDEGLKDTSAERVSLQSFSKMPFLEKRNIRSFKKYLFDTIYRKRIDIFKMQIKLRIIGIYEKITEEVYKELVIEKIKLDECLEQLKNLADNSAEESDRHPNQDIITSKNEEYDDEYLGQNVNAYYKDITGKIIKKMESDISLGRDFYFEENFFGNIYTLLKNGIDSLIKKASDICLGKILTNHEFFTPFEEELLNRANKAESTYENKKVLTREELFKRLYKSLEKNAAVNCRVYNFTQKHRYEEKYFFGDSDSDFIKYAFKCDKDKRTYKLGCIHEKRTSGIEKLDLMGGFHISNLIFTKNCMKYYDAYIADGFQMHSIDPDLLPQLKYVK